MSSPGKLASVLLAALVSLTVIAPIGAYAYEVSASATLASDYRFRGISQTSRNPAVQGGIELATDSGFSFGLWGSNVDFALDPVTTTTTTNHSPAQYGLSFARSDDGALLGRTGDGSACDDLSMVGCNPDYSAPDDAQPAEITFLRSGDGALILHDHDSDPNTPDNPVYVAKTTAMHTTSGASTSMELDVYVGYAQEVSGLFSWSVSYVGYYYPGYSDLNYPELLIDFDIGDF